MNDNALHDPTAGTDVIVTDAHGRPVPSQMSDRAIAEETLVMLRAFADALEVAASNPMLAALMPRV